MSAIIKITGWLLMTVMHSGTISTAQFPTEALCKDGVSIAQTGKTVAEAEHDAMATRAAYAVDRALWELNNPRHEPATDAEWAIVRKARDQPAERKWATDGQDHPNGWPRYVFGDDEWEVFEDGTIQKQKSQSGVDVGVTGLVTISSDWITNARCFPIPEDEK